MDFQDIFHKLVGKLDTWLTDFILHLPNITAAVVVFVLFWVAARLIRRGLGGVMDRLGNSHQLHFLITQAIYIAVLVTGMFVALGIVGADKTVTSLLAGAGIIGLALGLAFQALGENFVAGIYLAMRRPFAVGQMIETNGYYGMVEHQDLRATWLRVPEGQLVLVPNKSVFTGALVNFSDTGLRRVDLAVGVTYGSDLLKVREVATGAVEGIPGRERNRPVELFYKEFGDSSINFEIRFWIRFREQIEFLHARSEAVIAIKQAFDDNGITIPFPIRTLDFGEVGGERLAQTLRNAGLAKPDSEDLES
ncbi:MAG: mechanosensitive ion channel family protein [Gammaproteobacteria bacterium]|jgi:small conductance mechanosensitive channel